jgi:hypothetical protein
LQIKTKKKEKKERRNISNDGVEDHSTFKQGLFKAKMVVNESFSRRIFKEVDRLEAVFTANKTVVASQELTFRKGNLLATIARITPSSPVMTATATIK